MTNAELIHQIKTKKSFLCVGLDSDIEKLPKHFKKEPQSILEFNRSIIEATKEFAVSYKINTAFYESLGAEGWQVMEETAKMLPKDTFNIADAKRGDIGNTATQYAKAFFENMQFDAITLSPYMGLDSFEPYLAYQDKWIIPLALTSNSGSEDFQKVNINGTELYEVFLEKMANNLPVDRTMFVIGATNTESLKKVRSIAPEHFYLVPGVGTQGGTVENLSPCFLKEHPGVLVNVSRAVIFAGNDENFAQKASDAARGFKLEMEQFIP